MSSSQLTWSDAGREVRRSLVAAAGWVCFILASLALLFAPHLTPWAAPGLFALALLGGACVVYGEVSPWLERRAWVSGARSLRGSADPSREEPAVDGAPRSLFH